MKNSSQLKERDTQLIIVDTAERLFSQIGFKKTTVADIAQNLRMSPGNLYRFFTSKAEINEAVGRRLLSEVEAAVDDIVKHSGHASEKLRAAIAAIEKLNWQRFQSNPKLHELVETAFNEHWTIVYEYDQKLDESLTKIISQGNREGEFHVEDSDGVAILVHSTFLQFCHPRLMVECAEQPEPTVDQMVDFCIAALASGPSTLGNFLCSPLPSEL